MLRFADGHVIRHSVVEYDDESVKLQLVLIAVVSSSYAKDALPRRKHFALGAVSIQALVRNL